MNDTPRREDEVFADEVLRIARALWPTAEFQGASIFAGQERDGIFDTEDCIHFIEATTSRRQEKAKKDLQKLHKIIQQHRSRSGTRALRGWFITRDEPTADQRKEADKYRHEINTLSFAHFQSRLVNSRGYLSARANYAFGSVRDPATGKLDPRIEYVPIDLTDRSNHTMVSPEQLREMVSAGQTVVLLGDYGAGKSMTLRHVYKALRKRHLNGTDHRFPVYLNLRDHVGQTDTSEIMERHARSIGFSSPSHIVRAWRAGYVHLFVDGFDEVTSVSIQGLWRRLRDYRYRSMEMVRRLIRDNHQDAGILVAGRAHFFDSSAERHRALGLRGKFRELSLNDFSVDQMDTYLARAGINAAVPSWLPSRPLLLGYLAAKGILRDVLRDGDIDGSPAAGWNALLDRVCAREAEIEAGIDGPTVRRILERLASKARASASGLGSLTPHSIVEAFHQICGYEPDERGMVLLQRLPGLGVEREEENSRVFLDESFVDACRAGDLTRFIQSPYDFPTAVLADIEGTAGQLAVDVSAHRLTRRRTPAGKIRDSLRAARGKGAYNMMADIVRVLVECGFDVEEDVLVEGLFIGYFEVGVSTVDMSGIAFRDCFFERVEIGHSVDSNKQPTFYECYIGELDGRVSVRDLPSGMFDDGCDIEEFVEAADTTSQVLSLDLPLGTRVCITVLKKMYEQRGGGRRENALYRGLDSRARRLVPDVLRILQSEGLAYRDKSRSTVIWRPDRRRRARVGKMIAAPRRSSDAALHKSSGL